MYYYSVYGFRIASDYPLGAARPVRAFLPADHDILVRQSDLGALTVETEMERKKGSGYFYRYERLRGWVRVVGNGCFLMQNGREIQYQLKDTHDPTLIPNIILCMCIPLLLVQKQRLMIHGSCVLWNDRAVIISGESGVGKSTLTKGLLCDDGVFMADDTVVVAMENEQPWAYPGFPQQKLTKKEVLADGLDPSTLIRVPGEGVEKYAVRLKDGYCSEKKVLQALIVLQVQEVEYGSICRITGNEKLRSVTDNLFQYTAYQQMGFSKSCFLESVAFANAIDVFHLVRPPSGMSIAQEVALVRGALEIIDKT